MAQNVDFDKVLEDALISSIRANTGYNVDHFYGAFDPQQLLHWLKGRVNAGNGTCFVRVSGNDYTPVDTLGKAYNVNFTIQVVVGYKPMRSKQLPDSDRETDAMKTNIRPLLAGNMISIDGDNRRLYLKNEDSLVYTPDIDAQLIEGGVDGVYVEFN